MNKIKAVIFDMDGVLVDAKDWHYEALNKSLSLFGMEISRYDHLVTYDGLPTKRKLEMLSREKGLPHELHEFINEMKQVYTLDLIYQKCKPTFQHLYTLSKLRIEGYKLVVCSNSIKKTMEVMLDKAELLPYIEFYLSNQDVLHPKPQPEIYQKAIQKMQLNPQQCLILEDNEHGLKAAQESGAHVLKVHSIDDVNFQNIKSAIRSIEGGQNG
jgi:HAD superfamily hydrolase (TIGR01509 family)